MTEIALDVLNAIEKLRRDILHIESYESIDDYMRGRRDMIHVRLDGLIVHVSHLVRDVRRENRKEHRGSPASEINVDVEYYCDQCSSEQYACRCAEIKRGD